jgi:hypothetical protein
MQLMRSIKYGHGGAEQYPPEEEQHQRCTADQGQFRVHGASRPHQPSPAVKDDGGHEVDAEQDGRKAAGRYGEDHGRNVHGELEYHRDHATDIRVKQADRGNEQADGRADQAGWPHRIKGTSTICAVRRIAPSIKSAGMRISSLTPDIEATI